MGRYMRGLCFGSFDEVNYEQRDKDGSNAERGQIYYYGKCFTADK